jgi:hypothetical protein
MVVIVGTAAMIIAKLLLPVAPAVSVRVTVKEKSPVAVGVPVTAPVLPRLNPVGKVPLVTANW